MSAPSEFTKEADNIKYGFLAVKSKTAITKVLNSEALMDEEFETLSKAHEFLLDISQGVELVSTGTTHNVNAQRSLAALSYAMNPLESLQSAFQSQDEDISKAFSQLAEIIPIDQASVSSLSDNDSESLKLLSDFFEFLCSSLLVAISENSRAKTSFTLNCM